MSVSNVPTDPAKKALHWAAVAVGLKEVQEREHGQMCAVDRASFEEYQAAARSHGFTDDDIRAYRLIELG